MGLLLLLYLQAPSGPARGGDARGYTTRHAPVEVLVVPAATGWDLNEEEAFFLHSCTCTTHNLTLTQTKANVSDASGAASGACLSLSSRISCRSPRCLPTQT